MIKQGKMSNNWRNAKNSQRKKKSKWKEISKTN